MGTLKNPRHEAFAQALFKGMPAVKAYVAAGYSANKASATNSQRLTNNDEIQARVAELQSKTATKAVFDAAKVLESYINVATADPNGLIEERVCACRHCHGLDHDYQWRTQHEFMQERASWAGLPPRKRKIVPEPTDAGGYGYSKHLLPVADCPNCDGDGTNWTVVKNSKGHPLYAGVKHTKDGFEIKMLDRMAALEQIGRILGVFEKDNRQKGVTSDDLLLALLARTKTTGSKLPFDRAATTQGEKP